MLSQALVAVASTIGTEKGELMIERTKPKWKKKVFWVETFRPPYPSRGVGCRVHCGTDFDYDKLSANLTSLWEVHGAATKSEAIALVAEKAAGFNVTVYNKIGKFVPAVTLVKGES